MNCAEKLEYLIKAINCVLDSKSYGEYWTVDNVGENKLIEYDLDNWEKDWDGRTMWDEETAWEILNDVRKSLGIPGR